VVGTPSPLLVKAIRFEKKKALFSFHTSILEHQIQLNDGKLESTTSGV
jgi:hypothetical protein